MKVVFLQDVQGVAQGGEVKEVKNGFARNYLLPKQLAVPASHNALRGVQRLAQQAEAQRLKTLANIVAARKNKAVQPPLSHLFNNRFIKKIILMNYMKIF